jgi:hypothetical protein
LNSPGIKPPKIERPAIEPNKKIRSIHQAILLQQPDKSSFKRWDQTRKRFTPLPRIAP